MKNCQISGMVSNARWPSAFGVRGDAAPSDQPQLAAADGIFDGSARIRNARGGSEKHTHAKQFVRV